MSTNIIPIFDADVEITSHGICFSKIKPNLKQKLREFCLDLRTYEQVYVPRRGRVKKPKKTFAASNIQQSEYRFHIHQKEGLFNFLKFYGFDERRLNIKVRPANRGVPVDFELASWIAPYDYQERIIDYFVSPGHCKVTTLQTGFGKTICAMVSMVRVGVRSAVVVPGKYVHKWVEDLKGGLNLTTKELMVVRGARQLSDIINLAKAGELDVKAIIITSTTLQRYFVEYEHGNESKYGCPPSELYELLGVGLRLIDETHENLHLNYKQDLYGHLEKALYLSATLDVDDPFIDKILNIAYPKSIRFNGVEYDAYVAVEAINYHVKNVDRFNYMGRNKMYSHILFEESILSDKERSNNWLNMIKDIIELKFIARREKPTRMLVFSATIEMCTFLTNNLKDLWPKLDVGRFVGEDDDELLYTQDISFTTLKSAGTAVDIPGLEVCILTVALGSRQLNEQAKGRLRKFKGELAHLTPRYYYLNASNIPKHMEYHKRKMENFKNKVKSHKIANSGFSI